MSDDKKIDQQTSKITTVLALRTWVLAQLEAIKNMIPSLSAIRSIAAEEASKVKYDTTLVSCRIFIINVRWEYPSFGGIPMPPGICFYGFNTFWYTEEWPGAGVSEAALKARALAMGALESGLTVESISELPTGWEIDNTITPDPEAEAF